MGGGNARATAHEWSLENWMVLSFYPVDCRDQSQGSGDKHLYHTEPSCQSKSSVSVNCVYLLSILAPAPAFCIGYTSFLKLTVGLRSVQR